MTEAQAEIVQPKKTAWEEAIIVDAEGRAKIRKMQSGQRERRKLPSPEPKSELELHRPNLKETDPRTSPEAARKEALAKRKEVTSSG